MRYTIQGLYEGEKVRVTWEDGKIHCDHSGFLEELHWFMENEWTIGWRKAASRAKEDVSIFHQLVFEYLENPKVIEGTLPEQKEPDGFPFGFDL